VTNANHDILGTSIAAFYPGCLANSVKLFIVYFVEVVSEDYL